MAASTGNGFPQNDQETQRKSEKERSPEIPQQQMIPANAPKEKIAKAIEEVDFDEN